MLISATANINEAPLGASMSVLNDFLEGASNFQPEFHFAKGFFSRNHFVNLVPQPVSMPSTVQSPVYITLLCFMGCAVWTTRTSCMEFLRFVIFDIRFFFT